MTNSILTTKFKNRFREKCFITPPPSIRGRGRGRGRGGGRGRSKAAAAAAATPHSSSRGGFSTPRRPPKPSTSTKASAVVAKKPSKTLFSPVYLNVDLNDASSPDGRGAGTLTTCVYYIKCRGLNNG